MYPSCTTGRLPDASGWTALRRSHSTDCDSQQGSNHSILMMYEACGSWALLFSQTEQHNSAANQKSKPKVLSLVTADACRRTQPMHDSTCQTCTHTRPRCLPVHRYTAVLPVYSILHPTRKRTSRAHQPSNTAIHTAYSAAIHTCSM